MVKKRFNGRFWVEPKDWNHLKHILGFGWGFKILELYETRLELKSSNYINLVNTPRFQKTFKKFFFFLVPEERRIRKRKYANIMFLDTIRTYRGWRQSNGLPSHGQRTWTNAWSAFRNNTLIRERKLTEIKKMYATSDPSHVNMVFLAEQINLLWKLQWEKDWRKERKKVLQVKRFKKFERIDLESMSRGEVMTKKLGKKKQKKIKSALTLGFNPGFTKSILKILAQKKRISFREGHRVEIVLTQEGKKKKKRL